MASTPREIAALRRVWMFKLDREERYHADEQANYHNEHFQTNGLPWIADDFLKPGHRTKRQMERMADKAVTMRVSSKSKQMGNPEDVPEWAREVEVNNKRVN